MKIFEFAASGRNVPISMSTWFSTSASKTNRALAVTALFVCSVATAEPATDACLLEKLASSGDEKTVGELRAACGASIDTASPQTAATVGTTVLERGAIRERIDLETGIEDSQFTITPHFPNFVAYSVFDANQAPFEPLSGLPDSVEDQEAVFQVSFKAPIWRDMFGTDLTTYFAYTSKSWWQVANDSFSSPFRETNYMPEFFVRSVKSRQILGSTLEGWTLGFVHESNGREQALSRSWNRVMGRFGIQVAKDLSLLGQVWYRIPDDEDEDDNPNEYQYYGYGDLRAVWTPNKNNFTALVRPGTKETSFELTWSYPISRVFRVYAGYYNGYGESLLDYDFRSERFSLGIALNDFLTRQ